ncbi:hypothetical protein GCM10023107_81050 [Actinoplanes octamycinicus]|nr:hypothetical protein Aoc01nite_37150 [Actinoplanes octamycinicus]
MEFVPVLALGTLVFTLVLFLKNLSARQWGSVVTQLIAWAAGIGGVFLMASTSFAAGITIGDQSLDALSVWSKVLIGLLATSLLSVGNEFKKAIDRSDSAAAPAWFGGRFGGGASSPPQSLAGVATPEAVADAQRQVAGSRSTAKGNGPR